MTTGDESEGDFDIAVEAVQFNEVITKSSDSERFVLNTSEGILSIEQGQRALRLKASKSPDYLPPYCATSEEEDIPVTWRCPAWPLQESLSFVIPLMHVENENRQKSGATLGRDGAMTGGRPDRLARLSGLDRPPRPLNFGNKEARKVVAFLKQIGNDVEIMIDGVGYKYSCPISGHTLQTTEGRGEFKPRIENLEGEEFESLKICRESLLSSLVFLGTVIREEHKSLGFLVRGQDTDSSITLTTQQTRAIAP